MPRTAGVFSRMRPWPTFRRPSPITFLRWISLHEIVLKRGAQGASWFGRDGGRVDVPAFIVDEIDPTGAGDCFGGAYVACRRLGMTPQQSLLYGNAAGARNVTMRGPMEGAGTRAELDAQKDAPAATDAKPRAGATPAKKGIDALFDN